MTLRPAEGSDHAAIWAILQPVFRAGETYCIDPQISEAAALAYWCGSPRRVFIAAGREGAVLGTYYLTPNQPGGGAHVANCGFATAAAAQGQGIARAMLTHALDTARDAGFHAMQFNFVVQTNGRAVALWQRHGFEIVGRLPGAFRHPAQGYVDALVMYRVL
ncbi:MAG: GNAT family N-acetyltransferase [Pseudomonadota bacterium]